MMRLRFPIPARVLVMLLAGFCLIYTPLTAQTDLSTKMAALTKDSLFRSAQLGISVRDLQTGKVVYEYNGRTCFTPASNLKLVTTATALALLGPDFRFVTRLSYTSNSIKDSLFTGILQVIGSGDPTLGSAKMAGNMDYKDLIRVWVSKIKTLGINEFGGTLVLNAGVYEYNPVPNDYTWGDIGNYYGAGSYGINMNENQYVLNLQPGTAIGKPATLVSRIPFDTSITFINHIKTGVAGSGDKSIIYAAPYTNTVFAEGTIPMGGIFTVKGSIPDPCGLLSSLLITEMKSQGIEWKGTVKVLQAGDEIITGAEWTILTEQKSPPLSAIIRQTNYVSNNLYAECLLKQLSVKHKIPGSTSSSVFLVKKYLQSIGVDTVGMVLRDGSGMSPFNAISPNQLTQLLYLLNTNTVFVESVPVAGRDGTVNAICKGTGDKIRVKSGSLNGTTCYSGYITTVSGKKYSVSFMVNKHEAKTKSVQKVLERSLIYLASQ